MLSHTGNSKPTSVAVIGLGSIGGVVAGLIAAVGRHDLIACVRQPLDRLVVDRAEGTIDVPIRALTDPARQKPWTGSCYARRRRIRPPARHG